jgi:SOS response regulatory protein OraA/RecX
LVADINENLIEPAQAARILEQVCRRLNQLDQPNEQGYAEQTGQPHAKAAKSKKTLWRKLFG